MTSELRALVRALQSQKDVGRRKVSLNELISFGDRLFPSSKQSLSAALNSSGGSKECARQEKTRRYLDVRKVSPGWSAALSLLDLAGLATSSHEGTTDYLRAEHIVAAHLLEVGRFPADPKAASIAVEVLQRWRRGASGIETASFPPSLSLEAAGHLAFHISLQSPSAEPTPWKEALALYHFVTRREMAPVEGRAVHRPGAVASLRHSVLATLLRSGAWEQALHFFKHSLYQRDMPDSVSTGFLIQTLSTAGRVTAILQVYDLCVKLLKARTRALMNADSDASRQTSRGTDNPTLRRLQKQWGTTFSMAMAAVCSAEPEKLETMLKQLLPSHNGTEALGVPSPPLAQLDGNFLAAVQRHPRQNVRQRVLEQARAAHMLDFFKLIRGLCSKGYVKEALRVFTEGVTAHPPALSRKEVGSAKILLLGASSYKNVEEVVAALHLALRRDALSLRMNDAEVETILSKSAAASGVSERSASVRRYWDFCLRVMAASYSSPPPQGRDARTDRQPSLAQLTFIMRNPLLPWMEALRLVESLENLPVSYCRRHSESTDSSPQTKRPREEVLVLNAAAEVVHAQGHTEMADELVARSIRTYNGSPSAEFLTRASSKALRELLLDDSVAVDPRVLYHLLHKQAQPPAAKTDSAGSRVAGDGPLVRPLEIVSLLMERTSPCLPRWGYPAAHPLTTAEKSCAGSWLAAVPASVHCEALACVRRCVSSPQDRWRMTVSYLDAVRLPAAHQFQSTQRSALLQSHYSATWEAVHALLSVPTECADALQGPGKVSTLTQAIASATIQSDFVPPAHMLLPNQMDRLLTPAFTVPHGGGGGAGETRAQERSSHGASPASADSDSERDYFERCCVAEALVAFGYRLIEQRLRQAKAARRRLSVEPVVLHGLMKLCCRLGEHTVNLTPAHQLYLQDALCGHAGSGTSLEKIAAQLLDWQAQHNGISAVPPRSLHLLYSLCAAHRSSDSNSSHAGAVALQATRHLLELERTQSSPGRTPLPPLLLTQRRPPSVAVNARHYAHFSRLFGWEAGLQTWYEACPKEVLLNVSRSPEALNFCLSLDENCDQ